MFEYKFNLTDKVVTTINCSYKAKDMLEVLNEMKEKLHDPFIWQTSSLFGNNFLHVHYGKCNILERGLVNYFGSLTGEINIWKIANKLCTEDVEWGDERNKGYQYRFYIKYQLKDNIIKLCEEKINEWIIGITDISEKLSNEERKQKEERESRRKRYQIIKTYKLICPQGGEDGRDGYADMEIINIESGETMRMIARNVFDFGFYVYPKRLEGTDMIFEQESWNKEEIEINDWINQFPPFSTGVRM